MLEYNEVTVRKYILFENEPYEVLDAHVFRKQQRKPVNAAKLRNIITGRIVEHSFHVSDKVEEAEIITKPIKFLYANRGQYWFVEVDDATKRFALEDAFVGRAGKFLKANTLIDAVIFNERIIGVKPDIKVELKVTEAPPAVKGDTAKGGVKQVTLENGATINAPLFVNVGDIIRINTDTEEYVERVS